ITISNKCSVINHKQLLIIECYYEEQPIIEAILPRLYGAMIESELFDIQKLFVIDYRTFVRNGYREKEDAHFALDMPEVQQKHSVQLLEKWLNENTRTDIYVGMKFYTRRGYENRAELANGYGGLMAKGVGYLHNLTKGVSGIEFDFGSYRVYHTASNPEHAEKNMYRLLDELEVFTTAGITDIYGWGNEFGIDTHVCYHDDITTFITDMNTFRNTNFSKDSFTEADLRAVIDADETKTFAYKKMGDGYVVWSIEGARYRLHGFYNNLHKWCKRNLLTKFEDKIYATWADHIGLPKEDLRKRGYHIERLEDLDSTQSVQLFKLGRFAYLRCDAQLYDLLTEAICQLIADDTVQDVSGNDIKGVLTQKQLDYDHTERVFYLHPDDFMPVPDSDLPIRALTEVDTPALELLKTQCTEEEFEDSWVSATDELSFGAFDGDRLVACASMYQLWGFADPGVLVDPAYRKRRLGVAVVSKICEQVIADGLIMNYRCTVDNIASMKLATRLGFKQHFVIEVFKITDV
ncbi:MAG: GNAT family N-acetyltransferase, partial [Chloroflexota bacterium]